MVTTPHLIVVEDRNSPREARYKVFVEEFAGEGSAVVGAGPTEPEAIIDAQSNLEELFRVLRTRDYDLQILQSLTMDEYWRRHLATANAR